MKKKDIKKIVREGYGKIARGGGSCCSPGKTCGSGGHETAISRDIGYSDAECAAVPAGANLGLGCGNPTAFASLRSGETVVDLGSGAGFDCFLAAQKVGKQGAVIGVDMTPEMVAKAAENARAGGYTNVDFRLGEIEHLPVADDTADVIISNCVINLSPDKEKVFREAFRVLKKGGRLSISDLVLLKDLPPAVRESAAAYIGCLSGAVMKDRYLAAIRAAGFTDVAVIEETSFPLKDMANDPTAQAILADSRVSARDLIPVAEAVVSIKVSGVKPASSATSCCCGDGCCG